MNKFTCLADVIRFINTRVPGDEFYVLFAGRYRRKARYVRETSTGSKMIQTFNAKKGVWGSERRMTTADFGYRGHVIGDMDQLPQES